MFSVAPSWRSSSRSFLKLGSNKPSNNSCMRRPPPPCASCTRSESLSGVGHCNGKFLTSAMCLAPHVHQVIAAQPAITVISSASSLGRHHRRPQGMVRGAAVAVRRAILGLLRALHHQAADALWILLGRVSRHTKPRLRIKLREFGGQPQTALRYFTDAAPLAMYHSKDRRHQLLRRHIPFLAHRPRVLVLHFVTPFLQLRHTHVDALQQVERLEASHHDRDLIFFRNRFIFLVAHHRANMPCSEESLHKVVRRSENYFHRGWYQHMRHQH